MPIPLTDRAAVTGELRQIALKAGAIIMRHYRAGDGAVREKQDHSPVTDADEEASAFIHKELLAAFGPVNWVCEEGVAQGALSAAAARFFLVDPLDGTKEFIKRNGEFTVNIALIENGLPVAGVVYAPAKARLFFGYQGDQGGHAFEQDADPGPPAQMGAPRPITVRPAPAGGLTVVASRTHRDTKTDEYLAAYDVKEFRAAGSSLKFCLVAAGEADLYPRHGPTMEWDTAAGHAVLAAAGGSVTTLDGAPFTYGKADFRNGYFVAKGGR